MSYTRYLAAGGLAVRQFILIVIATCTLNACLTSRSKPSTPETEVAICLSSSRASDYHLVLVGMEAARIEFPPSGMASVTIPPMEGDTFEVLGVSYIDNDPQNFEVLRLMNGGTLIRTISLAQIEAMPLDQRNCRLLSLPIPAG